MRSIRPRTFILAAFVGTFLLALCVSANLSHAQQSSFVGDYDHSFNAPNGYYVDPVTPDPNAPGGRQRSWFVGGALLPDGSIIAGGVIRYDQQCGSYGCQQGDFYLKKFTPAGSVDTSFGTNGYVRTNFYGDEPGSLDLPNVLRAQTDGKIILAGRCSIGSPPGVPEFGQDVCMIRYNANGSVDTSFGNSTVKIRVCDDIGNCRDYSYEVGAGRVMIQSGTFESNRQGGTGAYEQPIVSDMAIQPDGKIVIVGQTLNWWATGRRGIGFIARFNPNGSLDTSFGENGIARFVSNVSNDNCRQGRGLFGMQLQSDGRIIAVGTDSVHDCAGSAASGNRFVVTRWTASGQLETVRYLDNNTAFTEQDEVAASALITRDGTKLLVSGSYRNLSGTPSGRQKMTLVRLNLSDLSLDQSFGTGGIVQYNIVYNNSSGTTLYIKAIQPDDKIIGTDNAFLDGHVVRFNPDGSSDQSFGNVPFDGTPGTRGRLFVKAPFPGGGTTELGVYQILVRPNGRINLVGQIYWSQFDGPLAAVSQNTNNIESVTTPSGSNVTVQSSSGDASVTLSQVNSGGSMTFAAIDPSSGGTVPQGYTLCSTCPAYDITTTASYTPPVTVCLAVPASIDEQTYSMLKLMHGENGVLVDRTTGHFTKQDGTRMVCGSVSSLSPFVIAQGTAPTAAPSRISGRVTTIGGAPLPGTIITLSGAQSRRTITDANGNYSFEGLEANGFYVVTPQLSNYTFGPRERSFSLNADKTDATFTATPDAQPTANPLDMALYFVRQQYVDFLGREPDAGGLEYWAAEIERCGSDSACIHQRRVGVSAAFFIEQEYQQTGSFVYRLYKGGLGRQLSYQEFSADRQQVVAGPNLDASKISFADAFVARAEFVQKYSSATTAESFADSLIQTIRQTSGVDLSDRRATLIGRYNAGRSLNESRSLALREAIESGQFKKAEYNPTFVLMEYFAYLRRDPDEGGYQFWLDVLNNRVPNNYRSMVCAFLTSTEYQRRFSSVVTHFNSECGQ